VTAVFATAAGVGFVSFERAREQMRALEACNAAQTGEWDRVLDRTREPFEGSTGLSAAECRCFALLATGAENECLDLMERVLATPAAGDWAPNPTLSVHLIQTWRDRGRTRDAADLAHRAAVRNPENPDLFYLELATRGSVENEEQVLRELETRLTGDGPRELRMRSSLANRHLLRGDPARALEVLGERPSADVENPEDLTRWFDTRALAYAWNGDLDGVRRTYGQWQHAGGDPREIRARYALTLSLAGLADPNRSPIDQIQHALRDGDDLDPKLREALNIRLILTLVNAERFDEALRTYDRARESFALEGLTRDELERAATHSELALASVDQRRGTLRFEAPADDAGAVLWLSPGPDEPVDGDYESIPLSRGRAQARRAFGTAPQRWVYRDGDGRTRASGTVTPRPGANVDVTIALGEPATSPEISYTRSAADGRRRVAVVLLDCADWRLVQYLRTRGELAFLDALIARGHRAVLESDPPLTAAALESLVSPGESSAVSFVGLVHQVGIELAGLASVGENPFTGLSWILPEREDLFSRIGAGELSAANLLFAHGGMQAGRHAEITGPLGARHRIPLARSERDLDRDERARHPLLARPGRESDALLVRTIAAELDSAEALIREGAVDLLFLRVEPLDILTHAHFAEAVRDGQDDGRGLLFSVYRYLDERLATLNALLDEDDVLVVMSDHGIRTAMEHAREAIFIAAGDRIPVGRATGEPRLDGVPRVLADWLGVDVSWPDTGVAGTRALARAN
jgi:tetratricopeptide (TPR) repeat protein